MKEKLSTSFSYFAYCIILIYGLYGCFHTTSPRLKEPIAFKSNSKLIVLTPNNSIFCVEFSVDNSKDKIAILEYKRFSPIHYFGGFYNIDSNNLPFGIRYYPDSKEIWLLELKLLQTNFKDQSFFANNFSNFTNEVFQFDHNGNLLIQGIQFQKFILNSDELNEISQLEKKIIK